MKKEDLKVGDFAVNKSEDRAEFTIGKKYPILALDISTFIIIDDDKEIRMRIIRDDDWSFEPNLTRLNTQSAIVEVTTKVLVTFEKTQIKNGEEFLIKTIELADMPDLRKEVEYQIHNLANPQADVVKIKWENQ